MRIGVISDTHGLLRPQALAALRDCELILHAGDIGGPEVLEALAAIAPLAAIRGNNDTGPWAQAVPETRTVEAAGKRFYLLHDLKALALDPLAAGVDVIVSGHSHQPKCERRDGVLYLNPGSAGPRRWRLPITLACLRVEDGAIEHELVSLD
ncbi:MAG: metallophosphoesterase family protein [Stagnimonas sp.]|nr:metallophosphoesterase family protein [Stagnimonas sp.]